MSNLIVASNCYNEEHRFLERYLDSISQLTDKIVLIDDGSTDNSLSICKKYTKYVYQTNHIYNENEAKLRSILWDKTIEIAEDGDYILNGDCDEIFTPNSIKHFHEQLKKCDEIGGDAIGWTKYDMWNETQYRDNPIGMSDRRLWIWCIKYNKFKHYYWNNLKLHGGSVPINGYVCALPTKLQIQHWAYSTLELRKQKVQFYKQYDPNAIYGDKNQYDNILEENPYLVDFKDNFEDIK